MTKVGARILAGARTLVGKPWGYHTAGPDSWGCVGMVVEAHRLARISLPNPYDLKDAQYHRPGAMLLAECDRLTEGEPGDIIIFTWPHATEHILHVGIVVSPTRMIDSQPATGVAEVEWRQDPELAARFVGYARARVGGNR